MLSSIPVKMFLRLILNNSFAIARYMSSPTEDAAPCGHGDSLALYLSHRRELVRYAANIVGDISNAEDIVQEAWLRFRTIANTRFLTEPKGYLYRIVRNLALDGRRRRGLEQRLFVETSFDIWATVQSDQPSQQTVVESRGDIAAIQRVIANMPDRTRKAFEMHRFQGLKLVEIAAQLGISKSLAHELVVNGIERCKKALDRRA